MNKSTLKILLLTALFPYSLLIAQEVIPNNLSFAKKSLHTSLLDSKLIEKLSEDKTYHIQRPNSDSLSAFLSDAVYEYLKESGYKTDINGSGVEPDSGLFIRIIEPMLNLNVRKGNRTLDGKFILLLYSTDLGIINWGEEYPVHIRAEDNVEGMSAKQLNSFAPSFLRIEKTAIYSGKKFEKVLALAVAGIITYLFYSVRG